jgi:hypothetical protein
MASGISEQWEENHDFPKVTFTLDGIWSHMGALFCLESYFQLIKIRNFEEKLIFDPLFYFSSPRARFCAPAFQGIKLV